MIKDTLYSKYIKEREGFEVFETEKYFVIYKIREKDCLISHMYVEPNFRKTGYAREMIEGLKDISKKHNLDGIVGTIDLRVGQPTQTMIAALNIGFKIITGRDDVIVIGIDLRGDS